MVKYFNALWRKAASILGAGMLLQAGGCAVDPASAGETLLGFILQRLIGDIVFGAFNVSTGGF